MYIVSRRAVLSLVCLTERLAANLFAPSRGIEGLKAPLGLRAACRVARSSDGMNWTTANAKVTANRNLNVTQRMIHRRWRGYTLSVRGALWGVRSAHCYSRAYVCWKRPWPVLTWLRPCSRTHGQGSYQGATCAVVGLHELRSPRVGEIRSKG